MTDQEAELDEDIAECEHHAEACEICLSELDSD